jgi:hypothetical protein
MIEGDLDLLLRDYVARNRDFLESAVLALVLPFVAGA